MKTAEELEAERSAEIEATRAAAIETITETARLFLRNLAFTVDQDALQTLFANYGAIEDIHLPQADGKPKGTAFVKFYNADDAVSAFTSLDGKQFHGRLLHILPAKAPIQIERPLAPGQKLNIGEKRKEERRREAAKTRFNWNALHLDQNAILETTAKKFGVAKSELLDPTQSNAGVTMALAEASALGNIRKFFLSHGVDLQSFKSSKQKDDAILLFKNLPSAADETAIRGLVESAGGVIRRFLMPDMGGLAIVELTDGNVGKSVFSKLAYRKIGDGVLYLEKGPVGTFSRPPQTEQTAVEDDEEDEEEESAQESTATLFVKNLNFETRGPALTRVFESLKGFRQATVKTKPDPRDSSARLSMGFGFVEFATEEDAKQALSAMQGFKLDDHALELKFSNGKQVDKPARSKLVGTKVVVKNLPFETTKQDVQRIFSTYGTLKSLRLPKKYNAHLRGFAFLEFVSKREAKNAIEAVSGTHLLGRRMIIEYAEEEKQGDEGVDELVEKTRKKRAAVEVNEGSKRKVGRIMLDTDEFA
jgi:multiple RNA-binding domain-containing protein 1